MASISIVDLEVSFCVGVPDEERSKPQRLLLTVEMELDVAAAVKSDRVDRSIDYGLVAQKIEGFGKERSWHLIERLASDLADMLLTDFRPDAVFVEVKKFPLPQARYVSVSLTRALRPSVAIKRSVLGNL